MTKYEWETELKKNIHRLPDEEIRRVMEYYDELFADKIERGSAECEIVASFGNPVDVADKILDEYDGELREDRRDETPPPPPRTEERRETPPPPPREEEKREEEKREEEKRDEEPPRTEERRETPPPPPPPRTEEKRALKAERLVIVVLLNILTGFAFVIAVGTLWIVALSVALAGSACALGGIAGAIVSVVRLCVGGGASAVAQIGVSVLVCGLGILLATFCAWCLKLLLRATKWLGRQVWKFLCPKVRKAA